MFNDLIKEKQTFPKVIIVHRNVKIWGQKTLVKKQKIPKEKPELWYAPAGFKRLSKKD